MLWRCVRSILAACVLAALLGAAPAAAQDDFPEPPPAGFEDPTFPGGPGGDVLLDENGFPIEDGEVFGFPGQDFDPDNVVYPDEWDPEQPGNEDLVRSGVGLVYDPVDNIVYDPFFGESFDPITGESWVHATGDPSLPVPNFILVDVRQMFGIEDPNLDPDMTVPSDANGTNTFIQPDPDNDARPHPMEDADDVLEHYGLGTPIDELSGFAIDSAGLPPGALPEALQFTMYEIALLFQLSAFDFGTPWAETFKAINEQFQLDGIPRDELINILYAVDAQFATRSGIYGQVTTIEDFNFMWAVGDLPNGMYEQLSTGQNGFIVGHEYAAGLLRVMASGAEAEIVSTAATDIQLEAALARAVEALEIQQSLNELQGLELEQLRAQVAGLANRQINELVGPVTGDFDVPTNVDGGEGDLILFSAIAGLAGLLVLGALFFFLKGRRERKGAPDPLQFDSDAAMATNQLLAGARDEDDILRILDRAAETQIGHPTTLFHAVTDGLQPVGSQTILTGSDLTRVVTTGQRAMTILRDDPAFPGETRAVIALPVIHGGKVQAVLTTHRVGDTPFTSKDLLRLEPIAPALGGALERSAELGTLTRLAMVDGLTSLGNRRRLDGDLEVTIANAVAGDAPLGFAMIDVDHFKTFNDTHGHSAGDDVLRKVASTIAKCVRESDVVYRYGGEEFSMLLPGATPEEAAHVAERVRAAVEMEEFPGEEMQPGGKLTVSVGVATLDSGSADDIRERADQALYRAKENGRNQVAYA